MNKKYLLFAALLSFCALLAESPAIKVGLNPRFSKRYNEALITNATFSPDSRILATTEIKRIRLWDAQSGGSIAELTGYAARPAFLSFSPGGHTLLTGTYRGKTGSYVRAWNVAEKKWIGTPLSMEDIGAIAVSTDDSTVAIAGIRKGDGRKLSLLLWNLQTRGPEIVLQAKNIADYMPGSLVFTGDAAMLIAAVQNRDHGIEIWDLKKKQLKKYLKTDLDVTQIAISPDQKVLAAGLYIPETRKRRSDAFIRLYEYPSLNKICDFTDLGGHVTSLSFYPGGRYLLSGQFSSSPNFSIFDLKTGKVHYQNKKRSRPALAARFSPDGRSVAVVLNTYGNLGNPSTLVVYDVGTAAELNKSGALNDINTFQVGEHVRAIIDGKEYSGEIHRKNKHHYLLKMDNAQPEYWKWLEPGALRPR